MFQMKKVSIPDRKGKVYKRRAANGTIYIEFEFSREYDPQKQYARTKRTTIGKQCEDDTSSMFPNDNYYKFFPDAVVPMLDEYRSACLRVGAYILIRKVIRDYALDQKVSDIIGQDSGLFLDLAAYSIVCEDNAAQYYPDYAFNHPLFTKDMHICSDTKVSRFLQKITIDESVQFLNLWNAERDVREKIYISYDSTNKTCQAGDIELAEYGTPKDNSDKPVIGYAIAYDRDNREPLFYEDYPGSVADVSQFQYMLETARGFGYRNIGYNRAKL